MKKNSKKWLAQYKEFNINLTVIPNIDLAEIIFKIVKMSGIKQRPDWVEQATRCILANLWLNKQKDYPTSISLGSNDWIKSRRPEILWSSRLSISKILKILLDLNYIDWVHWQHFPKEKKCFTGKYWLLSDKLITAIDNSEIKKIKPNTFIKLKDNNKLPVKYSIVDKRIKGWNQILRKYNKMVNSVDLTYNRNLKTLYKNYPLKFEKRFGEIVYLLNTNQITLLIENIPIKYIYINRILEKFFLISFNGDKTSIDYKHWAFNGDIQISGKIFSNTIFRVFNKSSFERGGRFYGAAFQQISGAVRSSFKIDGQDTVSLDYSGMHVRMLYHMLKQDFDGECYIYSKTKKNPLRGLIKKAHLIMLNSKTLSGCFRSLTDKRPGEMGLSKEMAQDIMSKFEIYHKPIKKYLFNDIGVKLQNLDSTIMNNILKILVEKNIMGLPIHDEIIVQLKHKDFVYDLMMEQYKEVMNFYPIIDKTI